MESARILVCVFAVGLSCLSADAAGLSVGVPFSNGAVLQRGVNVPVWGSAPTGSVVKVAFAGQEKTVVADANGKWEVTLAPLEASAQERILTVSSPAVKETKTVSGIVVGEVWLCSGQSNMEMSFASGRPRYGDGIGAMIAQVTHKPLVRYMKAPGREGWHRLTPEFLTSGWRQAIPVHYALELHEKLGIPVGVISASVGGSNIDRWIASNGTNATHHVSRIVPLGPFALRGALWYQGEANVLEPEVYPTKLGLLHADWRSRFRNPHLPFYFVQLAPFEYAKPEQRAALPRFMEAQAKYAASEPDAAIVVVNDIGNINDIHPNNKWLVSKRLALHALRRDYGFENVEDDSPTLASATLVATNRVRLVFDHAKSLYVYRTDSRFGLYASFELAGADGVWKKADVVNFPPLDWTRHGVLTNNVVELVAKGVERPVRVRHAYVTPYTGCLYNQVNLPCGPFCAAVAESAGEKGGVAPFADGERVTFLGDSITHGGYYHAYLQLYWDLRHPGSGTRLMNCGISGGSAAGGASRWSWDAAPQRADRTFVMFGMNDACPPLYEDPHPNEATLADRVRCLGKYAENMAKIADLVKAAGQKLVVMTPTPYDEYGANYKIPAARGDNEPGLAECAAIGRRLAEREGAGLMELHRPLTDFVRRQGEYCFCSEKDRVHPRRDGHLIIMAEMLKAMGEPSNFAGVDVDAAGRKEFEVRYSPKALPFPITDTYRAAEAAYPLTDTFNREMLTVRNLPAGRYRLAADGEALGEFDAEELLAGVNLATLPTPGAKRALEAWAEAGKIIDTQRKLRGNALIEVNVENDGVRTDDFDAVCAAMEAKVAKMREEKRPWAAYYEGQLREYRKNKSCEAKIREDEEAARNRLREIGKNPPAYVLRVSSVPRQPSAQRAPKES